MLPNQLPIGPMRAMKVANYMTFGSEKRVSKREKKRKEKRSDESKKFY